MSSRKFTSAPDGLSKNNSYKSIKVEASYATAPSKNTAVVTTNSLTTFGYDIRQPKLRIISEPERHLIPTRISNTIPKIEPISPTNRIKSRKVDSRAEAKSSDNFSTRSASNSYNTANFPKYIGTAYTNMPNAYHRPLAPPPKNPTIARPYPSLTADKVRHLPQLTNRGTNGAILGSCPSSGWNYGAQEKRYVDEQHVPYLPPDEPVGPDNPVKELNETWTGCWDKEAGAIYYYNKTTGEATWVPPDL